MDHGVVRYVGWVLAGAVLGNLACGGGDTSGPPPPPDPTKPIRIVIISPSSNVIFVGLTLPLRAVGLNADGDTLSTLVITWTSSDPTNAPVSGNGTVSGVNTASASITARAGDLSTGVPVKVVRLLTYSVAPFDTTLAAGQVIQYRLSGRDSAGVLYSNLPVVWQVNFNASLVNATTDGQVTALENDGGDVRFRLTLGVLFADFWITVAPAPVAHVSLPLRDLWVNQIDTLSFILTSQNGTLLHNRGVTWTSHNLAVATVSPTGILTALKSGPVQITLLAGTAQATTAFTVQALPAFTAVADGGKLCGLTAQGDVYCWTTSVTPPALVSNGIHFTQVSGSAHMCGVTASGQAYCWGTNNGAGQLGNGSTNPSAVPVPVSGGLSFSQVAVGGDYTCGVTVSGPAYCWGLNTWGTLGDGTNNHSSVPVPVSGGLNFTQVSASRVMSRTTCGVTANNKAYCWGNNEDGQFGTGDSAASNVPRLVSGGISWQAISVNTFHTCAIDLSQVAYCWGPNVYGGLGDGSLVSTAAPHPVIGGAFTAVAVGYLFTCGVGAGGVLKCWGWNESFQLGDGTQTQRPTPVTISARTFTQVATGSGGGCALDSIGHIYCWGGAVHTPVLMIGQE